jgi:signal transduction histidine kinase
LPETHLQPGISLSTLIRHRANNGHYGDGDPVKLTRERIKQIKKNRVSGYSLMTTCSGVSMLIRHYIVPEYGDITTLTDITELRKKEDQIATQGLLLKAALDNMTSGLAIYDDQHKLTMANQRFSYLFEFPDDLVKVGVHLNDLLRFRCNRGDFGNISVDEIIQEKAQILADQKVHQTEEKTTDGHWVEVFRSPTVSSGNIIIVNDITERRQTELALERLNTEKDKFFTIIAHDLLGPFASLVGVTELLAHRSDDLPKTEISSLHHSLHETGKNLYELLGNLFTWLKLQRDATPFSPLALELKPILDNNLLLYKDLVFEKDINIRVVNIPSNLILVDPNMLDTVIRNLIHNAIKFTNLGGNVIISANTDHEWMWIQVRDTGIGISEERIKNIFKLDSTLSTQGTKGEDGSGLGLHVCNELVKKCGGIIEAKSQEGTGTVVKFSTPLA